MSSPQTTTDLQAVADAIRGNDRFLVVTHENPDGDALGSLLATTLALRAARQGRGHVPLRRRAAPARVRLHALRRAAARRAGRHADRVLVAVDCAQRADRIAPEPAAARARSSRSNIDHHHDNSRFGDVNLIVSDASSTGEVMRDVLRELGVELTPEIAEPLYIALVTDTGRFQYTNTTPKSLRLAAELVDAGADVHACLPAGVRVGRSSRSSSCWRARSTARRFWRAAGSLSPCSSAATSPTSARSGRTPRGSSTTSARWRASELDGAHSRASARRRAGAARSRCGPSVDEVDVSAIARVFGGGGHRQAAGFSQRELARGDQRVVRRGSLRRSVRCGASA